MGYGYGNGPGLPGLEEKQAAVCPALGTWLSGATGPKS